MMLRWIKELYEFYFYMFYTTFKIFWWMEGYRRINVSIFFLMISQFLNLFTLFIYLVQFGSEFITIFILGAIAIFYFNYQFYHKNERVLLIIEHCKKISISRKLLYLIINICYIYFSIWLFGVVSEKYHMAQE